MQKLGFLSVISFGLAIAIPDVLATAQSGDILIVDGERHSIHTNPLEPLLKANPDMRPQSDIISSGLWRGYVATWEIVNGRLSLTDVEALRRKSGVDEFETQPHSVMPDMFPRQYQIFATWFTGHIIVPGGELVEYVHLDYASLFEKYTVLTIVKGDLQDQRRMTLEQFQHFRKTQFQEYQKTEEYKSSFTELKEDDETPEEVESFLFKVSTERYLSMIFDQ